MSEGTEGTVAEATEEKKVVKAKGNDEAYYLGKYPNTGLVEGSMVTVSRDSGKDDPTPQVGDELACGHEITAEDEAEWARVVPKGTKRLLLRKCQDSDAMFWVATSDVHQTVFAPDVRKAKQREKAREGRKNRSAALKAENQQLKAQLAELTAAPAEGETEEAEALSA